MFVPVSCLVAEKIIDCLVQGLHGLRMGIGEALREAFALGK